MFYIAAYNKCRSNFFMSVSSIKGHTGCVNAISWNSRGSLLISGSDDTQVLYLYRDNSSIQTSLGQGIHSEVHIILYSFFIM